MSISARHFFLHDRALVDSVVQEDHAEEASRGAQCHEFIQPETGEVLGASRRRNQLSVLSQAADEQVRRGVHSPRGLA